MSVAELKFAVESLPPSELAEFGDWWARFHTGDLTDNELMEVAAAGAAALDQEEEAHAARTPAR